MAKKQVNDFQHLFAKLLRDARLEAGFSVRALARLAGIDATYISRAERGTVRPPTWPKIAILVRNLPNSKLARWAENWGAKPMKREAVRVTRDIQALLVALPEAAFRDREWVALLKDGLEECMTLLDISGGPRRV